MKKILQVLILLLIIISCGDDVILIKKFDAANAEIKNVSKLISSNQGAYFYPKFGSKSDKIFFSTDNYSGIFYYDLKNKSINNMIDSKGTGLEFIQNKNDIYFVLPALSERTNRRIYSIAKQNIDSKKIEIIYKSNQGIKSLKIHNNVLSFFKGDSIKFYDYENKIFLKNDEISDVNIFSFIKDELLIYSEGSLNKIIPFSGISIINLKEIDNSSFLFEAAGKGVFKYSLITKQTEFLTDSIVMLDVLKNSNLAIGMKQENNGLQETASELYLFDLNTKELLNLTEELDITALNPSLSKDGSKVVFNSMEGDIYLMSLKISEGQAL